jgi:lambda repressor-like predicted transcriptional regulator
MTDTVGDILEKVKEKIKTSGKTFKEVSKHVGFTDTGLARAFKKESLKVTTLIDILDLINVDPIEIFSENSILFNELKDELKRLKDKNRNIEQILNERNSVYNFLSEKVDILKPYKFSSFTCMGKLPLEESFFYDKIKDDLPDFVQEEFFYPISELDDHTLREYTLKWELIASLEETVLLNSLGLVGDSHDSKAIDFFKNVPKKLKMRYRKLMNEVTE